MLDSFVVEVYGELHLMDEESFVVQCAKHSTWSILAFVLTHLPDSTW